MINIIFDGSDYYLDQRDYSTHIYNGTGGGPNESIGHVAQDLSGELWEAFDATGGLLRSEHVDTSGARDDLAMKVIAHYSHHSQNH